MNPIHKNKLPLLALVSVQILYVGTLFANGIPDTVSVRDTLDYIRYDFSTVTGLFSQLRTFGYPVFLGVMQVFNPDLKHLPMVQLLIYQLSLLVLWIGIRAFGISSWVATIFCLPLVFAKIVNQYFDIILPETLGVSFFLLALACTLFLIRKRTWGPGIFLLVTVFLGYQIKPAYVFLVVLIPFLSAIYVLLCEKSESKSKSFGFVAIVTMICVLPYIANSAYRYVHFESFAHTSFAGPNLISVAAPLINENVISQLNGEEKQLAVAVFKERSRRGLQPYPEFSPIDVIHRERQRTNRTPMKLTDDGSLKSFILKWYAEHDINGWGLAVPIAHNMVKKDGAKNRWIKTDRLLTGLSKNVISLQFPAYTKWIGLGYVSAVYRSVTSSVTLKIELVAVSMLLLIVLVRRRVSEFLMEMTPSTVFLLITPCLAYLLGTSLVLISQPPRFRYLYSTGILLESCFAVICYLLLKSLVRSKQQPIRIG